MSCKSKTLIFDGVLVDVMTLPEGDGRVVLGIGDEGEPPAAVLLLCPGDGVDGLIEALRRAAATARPHHPAHV
jgi:hypothetical protein